jgi:(heptosyl)LPS beta-1,4-glucosyltransferase
MSRITVITLTLNEAHNIGPCLESVRWADEILVIDSGSKDDTVPRARAYTPHICEIAWQGYGAARNFAIGKATGEWILWLDADERVTPELAGEIQQVLQDDPPGIDGFSIARRAYFLGRWIRHSGWYPGRVTRLFRRGKGTFSESRVHEQLRLEGTVVQTKHDLLHLTDPDLAHYLQKSNKYTTLAAQDMAAAGRKTGIMDITVRPAFQFLKMYVFRLGLLDGREGFILAVLSSAYVFTKYAKLWELTRTQGQGRS